MAQFTQASMAPQASITLSRAAYTALPSAMSVGMAKASPPERSISTLAASSRPGVARQQRHAPALSAELRRDGASGAGAGAGHHHYGLVVRVAERLH